MNLNKLFLRWIAVFGMVMIFAISGWGDTEPNGTCGTAESVSLDYSGAGSLSSTDMDDYYYFTAPTGGVLTAKITGSTSKISLYIYNNSCNSQKAKDDTNTNNPTFTYTVTAGTTYKIWVRNRTAGSPAYNLSLSMPQTAPGLPTNIPDQSTMIGSYFSLDLNDYFMKTNGDSITYTLTGTLPTGLTFNASSGVISGTPTVLNAGVNITAKATDNDGATSDTFKIIVTSLNYNNPNLRPFTLQRQDNIYGDMKIIGNSVMLQSGGTCAPNGTNNNDINTQYAKKDSSAAAASTFNSTEADLKLPKGVDSTQIMYAYLYWQGRLIQNADVPNGKTVKIKPYGSTSYSTITTDSAKFNWNQSSGNGVDYQGVADITQQIKDSIDQVSLSTINASGYNQEFWVADVLANKLGNQSNGFGAWSVVIVYKDPDSLTKFRSVSLFDGFVHVSSGVDGSATLNGFLTPKTGLVDAKFLIFGGEGDIGLTTDETTMTNNVGSPMSLGTNIFQSVESDASGNNVLTRNPNCQNTIGVDIRTFNVGNANGGLGIIGINQTTTKIKLTSSDDEYYPGVFAFSTELYMPQLCYDYSYKQDGQYLKAVNDGSSGILPMLTGTVSDHPIEVAVYLRNKEADIKVEGVSFHTDLNTTVFNYVADSTGTTYVNGTAYTARTDSSSVGCSYSSTSTSTVACNDGHNVRIGLGNGALGYGETTAGNLGSQEFVYAKFELQPTFNGIKDINESLGLKLDYFIQPDINAAPSQRNYTFGTQIDLCPPSTGYQPTWGLFNVVDHAASSVGGLPANNLRTQVSRKPYAVDVATYEKNPADSNKYTKVPTIDMNTTVLVEVIDNDAFHDFNASCANPGSVISEPIFVRIGNTSHDMTIDIPIQNSLYHNFAVKNAAYRIWYFDQNQSLIDWSATTSDTTRRNLSTISNLYRSTYHTVCTSSCGSPTSTACFNCIKANYARPLCSRDNFSVRPESYDLRIYDIDQNATAAQKDATKVDLSNQLHYAPMYGSALGRMNLAAGYNYRYDLNATGNDATLTKVPGYTRYFNGANSDYNATMIWDPQSIKTGCNDTTGKNLKFYVANGQMLNSEQNQTQVGEYRLNIIDPSWTAVDWNPTLTTHHTGTNGFESTKEDCVKNSDITSNPSGSKIGCTTTSAHSGGGYTYKDHNLRLKPARFDLSNIAYGVGRVPLLIGAGGSGFVYDSDLGVSNDMAMAVRTFGALKVVGYGGETLSNFVKDCYATDLNLSIRHDVNGTRPFSGRMTVADMNGTQLFDSLKFSAPIKAVQTIAGTYFTKLDQGKTVPTIRLNFDRNSTTPLTPKIVHYTDVNVSCLLPSDCNMSAMFNSTPNTAKGTDVMDFNVTHVYGRIISRNFRETFEKDFNTSANYEVYKTPILLGVGLPVDTFEADWRINTLHVDSNYGDSNVTVIFPTVGSSLPLHSNSVNGIETYVFNHFTVRQGYKAHIDTEGWLWYGGPSALLYTDPANPGNLNCLTHPCFNIYFGRIIGNTGSAKTESEKQKANKSTNSGTGWHTTREYAPGLR